MQTELLALRSGRMEFAEFAKATEKRWQWLARRLLAKWEAPSAVDTEDMVQELLTAAWLAVPKWERGRGCGIERFVVFTATTAAKRWLHRQRGVSVHGDRTPSRHAVLLFEPDDIEAALCTPPAQDAVAIVHEGLERAREKARAPRMRRALIAIAEEGSIDGATQRLLTDRRQRRACGITSANAARRLVWLAAKFAARQSEEA
jgi:DNA-directed RNA polymerase specialized sigma24 family protein